jgi:hypothetical protein
VGSSAFRLEVDPEFGARMASEDAVIRAIYCTIINTAFVPRALALQQSIAKHCPDALFAFYCIDRVTVEFLSEYVSVQTLVVPPEAYESDALRAAKAVLKLNEYCWTCKPAVLLHALKSVAELEWAVWLDSDMLAFGDLNSEFSRHVDASVILTPHRFASPEFAAYETTAGQFNAGYVAFRNTLDGRAALQWWMGQCLLGCPAEPTAERYADQKYLNALPRLFSNVTASDSIGLNCAPWSIVGKAIDRVADRISIEGEPLLLYHFQGLKIIRDWAFDLYGARPKLPKRTRELIYAPYIKVLASKMREVARATRQPSVGIDKDFVGMLGLFRAAKRCRWSPNLVVKW